MRLSTSASDVEVSTKAGQLHCTEHDCLSGALTVARMLCPDAVAQALANRAAAIGVNEVLHKPLQRGDLAESFARHLRSDLMAGRRRISRPMVK